MRPLRKSSHPVAKDLQLPSLGSYACTNHTSLDLRFVSHGKREFQEVFKMSSSTHFTRSKTLVQWSLQISMFAICYPGYLCKCLVLHQFYLGIQPKYLGFKVIEAKLHGGLRLEALFGLSSWVIGLRAATMGSHGAVATFWFLDTLAVSQRQLVLDETIDAADKLRSASNPQSFWRSISLLVSLNVSATLSFKVNQSVWQLKPSQPHSGSPSFTSIWRLENVHKHVLLRLWLDNWPVNLC